MAASHAFSSHTPAPPSFRWPHHQYAWHFIVHKKGWDWNEWRCHVGNLVCVCHSIHLWNQGREIGYHGEVKCYDPLHLKTKTLSTLVALSNDYNLYIYWYNTAFQIQTTASTPEKRQNVHLFVSHADCQTPRNCEWSERTGRDACWDIIAQPREGERHKKGSGRGTPRLSLNNYSLWSKSCDKKYDKVAVIVSVGHPARKVRDEDLFFPTI